MLNPYSFQHEGAAFLSARDVALLADEPGLGKTVQAILAVNDIGLRLGRVAQVRVVCPASVCESWRRHIAEWATSARTAWHVESYDMAAKRDSCRFFADVLILDEAHYLKHRRAKRTMAIYGRKCDRAGGIAHDVPRVFLLTGTPVPNNPSELWPHFRALFPGSIPSKRAPGRPMGYFEFEEYFCIVKADRWGHRHIKGGRNLTELRLRLSPHTLRRKKAGVLQDLPPVRVSALPLTVKETDIRQIAREAAGFDENTGAPPEPTLRRITGLAKVKPMADWVRDWLASGGGKLVLFAHHREVIHGLAEELALSCVILTGGHSPDARQEAIDLFQNDPGTKIFIGQLQAAGTGVTLTAASTAVLVESSWVPAENEQAAMRIHRIGQRNACSIRFAHAAGTIDERIQAAAMRKIETIKQLFV